MQEHYCVLLLNSDQRVPPSVAQLALGLSRLSPGGILVLRLGWKDYGDDWSKWSAPHPHRQPTHLA